MDTISFKEACAVIISVGLIVLIAYAIAVLKNLVVTVKQTNKILENTEVITKVAADKSKEVDKLISEVAASVGSVSDIIKGNQSKISALTSIVNAVASLKNLIKNES
ncbi:MAG: hypothetical protein FWG53_07235 [Clostridiales bacterium]|nr:hypothetical protein [Clostridiales bacterium]